MKKFWQTITGVNLIIAIIAINVVVSFLPTWQIDTTKDKLHSLSETTKKTVKGLNDVVTVKVFMTADLPAEVSPIAKDMTVILKEFEQLNQGKLKVSFADPNKDQNALKDAEKYGIQTLQFSSVKSDKFEVQNGYFGLVMLYGSKQEVLPVINDVGNLEYYIVSGIKRLTSKELPTVALYEDETDAGSGSNIQYLRKFLARSYQVVPVSLDGDSQIPSDTATLVIEGRSKKIDDKGLKKISDWINSGKGLVVFLDRVSVGTNMEAKKLETTGLEKLLADKGLSIEDSLVVDYNSTVANFQTKNGSYLVKYLYWPQVLAENIDTKNPVFSSINSLNLAWASPIDLSNGAKALFTSSKNAQIDDTFKDITPVTKVTLSGDKKKFVLAGINSSNGIKVALFGDTDMIKDQFVVNNQQNLVMALNMVDYFSQDSSLLQIRAKTIRSNPLKTITDPQKIMVKWADTGAPIVLLVAIYFLAAWLRKRKINSWYESEKK